MIRLFFIIFGFFLIVLGFSFNILYLNLLSIGYNFKEYVNFIISRYECYFLLLGIIIMLLSIVVGRRK